MLLEFLIRLASSQKFRDLEEAKAAAILSQRMWCSLCTDKILVAPCALTKFMNEPVCIMHASPSFFRGHLGFGDESYEQNGGFPIENIGVVLQTYT